jgi:hypothetical protein
VSAPAVRQIWDSIYGLEGHKADLPGGALPPPPRTNQTGQIVPRVPHARATPPATGAPPPGTQPVAAEPRKVRIGAGRSRLAPAGQSRGGGRP